MTTPPKITRSGLAAWLLATALALAACGGGGGTTAAPPVEPAAEGYDDPQAYSSHRDASLAGAVEAAAVTRHTLSIGGSTIAYTARAGHLIARSPATGAAQASVFHVAYTMDGAIAATRPVTFFFNGGPGSASVWLHLGSFGPKRIATGVPSTTLPRPFALVPNAESLLDTTDLVYVDAVGSGLSQAIAPFINRSFWGVDVDAALFRDFIVRWLEVNGRQSSPRFLYGESYGGPRAAVLARLLESAGLALTGVVLQSPAMDYNTNCGVMELPQLECAAYLPSYGQIGAWHGLTAPAATDTDAWAEALRVLAATRLAPALERYFAGQATDPGLPPLLAAATGLAASQWQSALNVSPQVFRTRLLPGQMVGRYDGRIVAPLGSTLAPTQQDDPSSVLIGSSFAAAITSELRETLRYRNASTYVMLSGAIEFWNFSHAGRPLPDTVPDLAEALRLNPRLRVLSVSGYHDLATPFHLTELDLARLLAPGRVQVRNYPGGHMTFLDDATRVRQKADLGTFYRGALAAAAAAPADERRRALAWRGAWPEAPPAPDRAGTPPTAPQWPQPQSAFQVPWREPWVPPSARPR